MGVPEIERPLIVEGRWGDGEGAVRAVNCARGGRLGECLVGERPERCWY